MSQPDPAPHLSPLPPPIEDRRRKISLAGFLSIGLALMMLAAVGSVLMVSVFGARTNLKELLRDKWQLVTDLIVDRIDAHLGPVEAQTAYIARWIEADPSRLNDPRALAMFMRGSLAALPQVAGVAFLTPDYKAIVVSRNDERMVQENWAERPEIVEGVDSVKDGGYPNWSPPMLSPFTSNAIIVYRQPVRVNGKFVGVIAPAVTVQELGEYLRRISNDYDMTAFVLYGRDAILAHQNMPLFAFEPTMQKPLPALDKKYDPVLGDIWSSKARAPIALAEDRDFQSHWIGTRDNYNVYIYRTLTRYGQTPWIVGAYAPSTLVGAELERFWQVTAVGAGILILTVIGTFFLGRRLSRPIRELARHAAFVRDMKLGDLPPLPRNTVKELDEASVAFNAMVRALRGIETYIPRTLVDRLLRSGREEAAINERILTVMFTDIVGFSTFAEHMPAQEVAVLLNEHFALVGGCIERHEGTIDKYIGDCVMAFWSAPILQPDHARRAYLAAKEVEEKMREYNARRRAKGLNTIRMRIGMHSGKVVVGNIGFQGRVNYTAVGDAVNVAQRIEQAGKDFPVDDDVEILASEDMREGIGEGATAVNLGRVSLRGREEPITVYRLT
jgi:class 3 adenylate cyclase